MGSFVLHQLQAGTFNLHNRAEQIVQDDIAYVKNNMVESPESESEYRVKQVSVDTNRKVVVRYDDKEL